MKKIIFIVLSSLLLACGDPTNTGQVSIVQGDIEIDVLVSSFYNSSNHDLTGTILSLKDNPDTKLFDLSRGVEPGQTISQYVKIRSQSNYRIQYEMKMQLDDTLNGNIFYFKVKKLNVDNQETTIMDTTNQVFNKDQVLTTDLSYLNTRGQFDIFWLQLQINPDLDNNFNLQEPSLQFSFSLLFVGEYVSEN